MNPNDAMYRFGTLLKMNASGGIFHSFWQSVEWQYIWSQILQNNFFVEHLMEALFVFWKS